MGHFSYITGCYWHQSGRQIMQYNSLSCCGQWIRNNGQIRHSLMYDKGHNKVDFSDIIKKCYE